MERKIALVTGSNRGIGFEIVRQLAERNFEVIATARNVEKLTASIATTENSGTNIFPYELDITNQDLIDTTFSKIQKQFDRLDVVINNAGIISRRQSISTVPFEDFTKVMDVNFYGAMRVTRAAIPLLRKSKSPCIINVSSGMGAWSDLDGYYAPYRMSKVSLNALTVMFANELGSEGFHINAVCPGWVRTDMGGPNAPRTVEQGADTVVWLASEKSVANGKFFRDRNVIEW